MPPNLSHCKSDDSPPSIVSLASPSASSARNTNLVDEGKSIGLGLLTGEYAIASEGIGREKIRMTGGRTRGPTSSKGALSLHYPAGKWMNHQLHQKVRRRSGKRRERARSVSPRPKTKEYRRFIARSTSRPSNVQTEAGGHRASVHWQTPGGARPISIADLRLGQRVGQRWGSDGAGVLMDLPSCRWIPFPSRPRGK
jgi:hypothetical protein